MSWTGFCVEMADSSLHAFGTTFGFDFFHFPEGYAAADARRVINNSYINKEGNLKEHERAFLHFPDDYDRERISRNRLHFDCYVPGLIGDPNYDSRYGPLDFVPSRF